MKADLNATGSPDDIPRILRRGADRALESAAEVEHAWQDKTAGKPWRVIALELEACARRIETKMWKK